MILALVIGLFLAVFLAGLHPMKHLAAGFARHLQRRGASRATPGAGAAGPRPARETDCLSHVAGQ
jgi:hypothetical protein